MTDIAPTLITSISGPYQLIGLIVFAIIIIFYLQYRDNLVKRKVDLETLERKYQRDREQLQQDQKIDNLRSDMKRICDKVDRQWQIIDGFRETLTRIDKRVERLTIKYGLEHEG